VLSASGEQDDVLEAQGRRDRLPGEVRIAGGAARRGAPGGGR
jgi:hypothetical protein